MQDTIKVAESLNAALWAINNKIRLASGHFTFTGREYLEEPMSSDSRRKCLLKGTQGGASLIVMLTILHGMIMRKYPRGVLYLMPTKEEVLDYSTSQFNPLIKMNHDVIGKYVTSGTSGKATDKASLKRVGPTAHLYFRSGTLPRNVDVGYKDSTSLKGLPCDLIALDEVDGMDEDVREKAIDRLAASETADEIYVGNPGVPNKGVDAIFKESDQRHWFMPCRKCGTETCAAFEFFENTGFIKMRDDGGSYLSCKKCGTEIFVRDGHWVADVPANSGYMQGWRWSGLILPIRPPHEILHAYQFPPHGNIGDVMRNKLGMAYINEEDALTLQQVYGCCGDSTPPPTHPGPCAMGVDVGDKKHVVIGGRSGRGGVQGDDQFEIFKVFRTNSWDDIHDEACRFNVKSAVVDLRPMADAARSFQKREKYKVWLCEYSESTPLGTQYNSKTGLVKVNRTEIFDATGHMVRDKRVIFPRKSDQINEFAKQMVDPTCVEEKDKRTNRLIRRYRGKNDHYRNALNYFRLAADGGKIGVAQSRLGGTMKQAYANGPQRRRCG